MATLRRARGAVSSGRVRPWRSNRGKQEADAIGGRSAARGAPCTGNCAPHRATLRVSRPSRALAASEARPARRLRAREDPALHRRAARTRGATHRHEAVLRELDRQRHDGSLRSYGVSGADRGCRQGDPLVVARDGSSVKLLPCRGAAQLINRRTVLPFGKFPGPTTKLIRRKSASCGH